MRCVYAYRDEIQVGQTHTAGKEVVVGRVQLPIWTWRLWDPTDETRITQSAEVSFCERSSRDVELLQEERPRLPVLIEDVYPMATMGQGEEADTDTSEVRSEENHCHGGSN